MSIHKTHGTLFYNISLAIGMVFIIAGFLLFATLAGNGGHGGDTRLYILCILCGAVFLYLAMIRTQRPTHLFIGMFLTSSGAFSLLVVHGIIPRTMVEWWPILVVFSGLCFFVAGISRTRKMRLSVVFPSATLVVLGVLFMLFSFHISPMSFRSAVAVFGPFCLVAMGIFIVTFFLLQRKYSVLRMPEEESPAEVFDAPMHSHSTGDDVLFDLSGAEYEDEEDDYWSEE